MEIAFYIALAVVALASLAWQAYNIGVLFEAHDTIEIEFHPAMMVYITPLCIGGLITIGLSIMAALIWLDPQQELPNSVVQYTGVGLLFTVIMTAKNIFGPLVNGWLAIYALYSWFIYGEPALWPVMVWAIGLVVDTGSVTNAAIIYTGVFVLLSIVTNGIGTISEQL